MAESQKLTISLIITTDRADDALRCCMTGVARADPPPDGVMVVMDSGDEAACTLAASLGATITQTWLLAGRLRMTVPAGDPAALVYGVLTPLLAEPRPDRLRRHIVERFGMEAMVDATERELRALMGGGEP
jgi:hypothetical protein